MSDLLELTKKIREFSNERHWGPYHKPKDLTLKLMEEVGELAEHFQWKSAAELETYLANQDNEQAVAEEVIDCLIILLTLSDYCLDVDLEEVFNQKLQKNAKKYPLDRCIDKDLL